MSELVPFIALFVIVALVAIAVGYINAWAAPRLFPTAGRVALRVEHIAVLVSAIVVVAGLVAAAVLFPHSVVGVFASTPEHVELSALVAAVAGALVQGVRQYVGKRARPGA